LLRHQWFAVIDLTEFKSHRPDHLFFDTTRKVVFYGQEQDPTTIRVAEMNFAVHGLDG
jgi:type I restriction enzyme M protein